MHAHVKYCGFYLFLFVSLFLTVEKMVETRTYSRILNGHLTDHNISSKNDSHIRRKQVVFHCICFLKKKKHEKIAYVKYHTKQWIIAVNIL